MPQQMLPHQKMPPTDAALKNDAPTNDASTYAGCPNQSEATHLQHHVDVLEHEGGRLSVDGEEGEVCLDGRPLGLDGVREHLLHHVERAVIRGAPAQAWGRGEDDRER